LSLKLLIDEDAQDKILVQRLRQAGHDVITVNEAGLAGQSDSRVLNHAKDVDRVLLTLNCRDFQSLHAADPRHSGILAIYQEANPLKKMSFNAIVAAIANLEDARISLAGQFIALNHWNY
jgi:hypothetical protein